MTSACLSTANDLNNGNLISCILQRNKFFGNRPGFLLFFTRRFTLVQPCETDVVECGADGFRAEEEFHRKAQPFWIVLFLGFVWVRWTFFPLRDSVGRAKTFRLDVRRTKPLACVWGLRYVGVHGESCKRIQGNVWRASAHITRDQDEPRVKIVLSIIVRFFSSNSPPKSLNVQHL